MDNYITLDWIGSGGQGKVYKAQHKVTKQIFAIKRILVEDLDSLNHALKEAQACLKLRHPNIVTCHEFFLQRTSQPPPSMYSASEQHGSTSSTTEYVCIVYEFCEKGSLNDLITAMKLRHAVIDEKTIKKWFKQICLGLHQMHQYKLLHRDLKPENIFITNGDNVKIGDLGFAKNIDKGYANTRVGSRFFLAPEVRLSQPYNEKLDIWGLGCILCKLADLSAPDYDYALQLASDSKKIFNNLRQRGYSEQLVSLIAKLLNLDPNERPTLLEVIKMVHDLDNETVPMEFIATIERESEREDLIRANELLAQLQLQVQEEKRRADEERKRADALHAQWEEAKIEAFFLREELDARNAEKEHEQLQKILSEHKSEQKAKNRNSLALTSLRKNGSWDGWEIQSKDINFREQDVIWNYPPSERPSQSQQQKVLPQVLPPTSPRLSRELSIIQSSPSPAPPVYVPPPFKGEYKGQDVAVEMFELNTRDMRPEQVALLSSWVPLLDIRMHCDIARKISHPHIVAFHGFCTGSSNNKHHSSSASYSKDKNRPICMYIANEYCELGSLKNVLQNGNIPLPFQTRVVMAIQAARAMMYLHGHNPTLGFRQISCERVLVKANLDIKLPYEYIFEIDSSTSTVLSSSDCSPSTSAPSSPTHSAMTTMLTLHNNDNNMPVSTAMAIGGGPPGAVGTSGNTGNIRAASPPPPPEVATNVCDFGKFMWELFTRRSYLTHRVTEHLHNNINNNSGIRAASASAAGDALEVNEDEMIEMARTQLHMAEIRHEDETRLRMYVSIMKACSHPDPAQRPSFRKIVYLLDKVLQMYYPASVLGLHVSSRERSQHPSHVRYSFGSTGGGSGGGSTNGVGGPNNSVGGGGGGTDRDGRPGSRSGSYDGDNNSPTTGFLHSRSLSSSLAMLSSSPTTPPGGGGGGVVGGGRRRKISITKCTWEPDESAQ